jgi:hypothetical protein
LTARYDAKKVELLFNTDVIVSKLTDYDLSVAFDVLLNDLLKKKTFNLAIVSVYIRVAKKLAVDQWEVMLQRLIEIKEWDLAMALLSRKEIVERMSSFQITTCLNALLLSGKLLNQKIMQVLCSPGIYDYISAVDWGRIIFNLVEMDQYDAYMEALKTPAIVSQLPEYKIDAIFESIYNHHKMHYPGFREIFAKDYVIDRLSAHMIGLLLNRLAKSEHHTVAEYVLQHNLDAWFRLTMVDQNRLRENLGTHRLPPGFWDQLQWYPGSLIPSSPTTTKKKNGETKAGFKDFWDHLEWYPGSLIPVSSPKKTKKE